MKQRQPMKTPVRATCLTSGMVYEFPSMAATAEAGFDAGNVRDCIRGRAKTHAGMIWEAIGPLRPERQGGGKRLKEAAALVIAGCTPKQVSEKMGITIATARQYINQGKCLGIVPKVKGVML